MNAGTRIGRWELRQELGQGGFATVYLVRESPSGREGALKLILGARNADQDARRRFQREVESLVRLRHPGVVAVLDAGEWERVPYLVMERVPGETLQDRLERAGPLPVEQALGIARDLALALAHVHAAGMVHRDVKPENVFLRPDGTPVLVDFGLVKDVDPARSRAALTLTGQYVGTPGYWAPEQAHGKLERVGPATDVWGLGATLQALLTGVPPYGAPGSLVDAMAAATRPAPPPSLLRNELDPAVDAVCRRALSIDPAARGTAEELAASLGALLEGRGRPRARWARRATRALLLVAALLAGLTGLALRSRKERAPSPPTPAAVLAATRSAAVAIPAPVTTSAAPRELDPLVARVLGRAAELAGRGDAGGALRAWERALELDPGCLAALRARARFHWSRGSPRACQEDAATVLGRAPDDAAMRALHDLAVRELDPTVPEPEPSEPELAAALAQDPEDARARLARALLRRARGDADGAQEDLEVARRVAPHLPTFLWSRGGLRAKHEDWAGARRDMERGLLLDPAMDRDREVRPAGRWALLAFARYKLEEYPAAVEAAERAVASDPKDAWAYTVRGLARSKSDPAGALEDLDRGVELAPGDGSAWANRGHVRAELGMVREALADYYKARGIFPPDYSWTQKVAAEIADLESRVATLPPR